MKIIIIAPDKSFTLNFSIMKYSKKLLYRHIKMLQEFRVVYLSLQQTSNVCIYEVTKLCKDEFGNTVKYIDFMLSGMYLDRPSYLDSLGCFDVFIKRLNKSDIDNLVHQCKEYGIL